MTPEEKYFEAKKIVVDYERAQCNKHNACSSLMYVVKNTADDEITLVRETKNGLKYLIFSNDLISYGRVGKEIGEYDSINFDGKNGKNIISAWIE